MRGLLPVFPALLLAACAGAPMQDPASGRLQQLAVTADQAYIEGNREAALTAYLELSKQLESDPVVWARLGHLRYLAGEEEQAFVSYQRALLLEPQYPEVLRNLATLHLDRATVHLEQALAGSRMADSERAAFDKLLVSIRAAREVSRDAR